MDIFCYCLGFPGDPVCEQLHSEFQGQETKIKEDQMVITKVDTGEGGELLSGEHSTFIFTILPHLQA